MAWEGAGVASVLRPAFEPFLESVTVLPLGRDASVRVWECSGLRAKVRVGPSLASLLALIVYRCVLRVEVSELAASVGFVVAAVEDVLLVVREELESTVDDA